MLKTSLKLSFMALAAATALSSPAFAQKTLTAVMHSDLKIVDPIWTTAYITRNHGYMIYDTLFALDEKGDVKPQMIDSYTASADKLTYTFKLRDGLKWHDGAAVNAEDCIASIKRWSARDSLGQTISKFVDSYTANDANTFTIKLKEPTGLLLFGLAKPSSNVPFMMPKRVADTDPQKQIEDFTGSGPFVFKKEDWKPGDKAVYTKFADYKPRSEPPSGLAGGKVVKFDQVIWKVVADAQQALNGLERGEIDFIEQPKLDLFPLIKANKGLKLVDVNPLGLQYTFRFNTLHKPFDNPKIRQALLYAFNQEDFLKGMIGDPEYYKVCTALFICGTPLETTAGMDGLLKGNVNKAKQLLQEAGYDGTPVVLMQSTDLESLTNLAPIAKQAMERAGFKVDMQSMDWQTLVGRRVKKDPPNAGGWNGFLTAWVSADVMTPMMSGFLNAGCEKAMFGWPCDAEIEKLRDAYARETDVTKLKPLVEQIQKRWVEYPTHVHLGQWYQPVATKVTIDGILKAPVPVFWNLDKK